MCRKALASLAAGVVQMPFMVHLQPSWAAQVTCAGLTAGQDCALRMLCEEVICVTVGWLWLLLNRTLGTKVL